MNPPICLEYRLGSVDYQAAWRLQDRLALQIAAGSHPPALLLLEHPHTYTFGRGGHAENLLWDPAELERRGVSVYWVDRGGDITYHGPGQLVGYPLLPLAPGGLHASPAGETRPAGHIPQADYVGYLRRLEETLIRALAQLGLQAMRQEGLTGVWVADPAGGPAAKIAAIGVKVDARGVSRHGFALNLHTDPAYWQGIVGCGLKDRQITSLHEHVNPLSSKDEVMDAVMAAFSDVFGYEMHPVAGAGLEQTLAALAPGTGAAVERNEP